MKTFIDTNVLIYAAFREDQDKRQRAREILERDDCVLSVQVLNEFIAQATRPSRPNRLPIELALRYVLSWRRFPIQTIDLKLFDEATSLFSKRGFTFWDSMIVAAARAQGCDTLYTEDKQDGRIVDGLRIVNPFT